MFSLMQVGSNIEGSDLKMIIQSFCSASTIEYESLCWNLAAFYIFVMRIRVWVKPMKVIIIGKWIFLGSSLLDTSSALNSNTHDTDRKCHGWKGNVHRRLSLDVLLVGAVAVVVVVVVVYFILMTKIRTNTAMFCINWELYYITLHHRYFIRHSHLKWPVVLQQSYVNASVNIWVFSCFLKLNVISRLVTGVSHLLLRIYWLPSVHLYWLTRSDVFSPIQQLPSL